MKKLLTFVILLAACMGLHAKQMKGKVVCDVDHRPVPNATLQVEYVDTIISYEADRKGRFCFVPLSFPVTITTRGAGMLDATIGLMGMPDSKLTFELAPDPAVVPTRVIGSSSAISRRLSSNFIVRSLPSKK